MIRLAGLVSITLITACSATTEVSDVPELAAEDIVSASVFLNSETRALQEDTFANPGYLWVDRGEALFSQPPAAGPACITCHEKGLRGVAATYPAYDENIGQVLNLEGRINQCRVTQQSEPAWTFESDELLSITAYVANQSLGEPISVDVNGPARAVYEVGRDYFQTRRGQFNLSCQQCHTENWGKRLRGDTLSQGHGNGFPAYRLEWESLGSLHRRLRDCDTGVRAEPLPYGDPLYVALELYLAERSKGISIETPGIRR
ncbi:MAG: sulfur oxidation c-type cytochrome SoxA [Hyphomonas sp.]|nr:sulfur oxidation c-type cytochrome SoxA [Hyphomonas sp.]